ncbi:MAG: cysteine synthase family protein [bacterium]|nr:cysteine synthase family protein [bacterium]
MALPGIYNSILDAIGNTPLVRLNRIADPDGPQILIKIEFFNPGESMKDRIALSMIEDAERRGELKPGGTVVEASSGNTAAGIAIVAAAKGYKATLVVTDKQSKEKVDALKALGAEVIIAPSSAGPDSPENNINIAKKIAEEAEGAYFTDQNFNQKNPEAHYRTTGPEIYEQCKGKISAFVMGMGTCGTISGIGKYLKEKDPGIKVIGVDPVGSILKQYFETGEIGESRPYIMDGVGDDIVPGTLHKEYIDQIVSISDKEAFFTARRLAKMEGILCGGSTGANVAVALEHAKTLTKDDIIVTIAADSGLKYLSAVYSDDWMIEKGFPAQ